MAMLTRWNPFKPMTRFDPSLDFDDLFRNFAARPTLRDFDMAMDVRIDVNEDDKSYKVHAEIPGVKKDDIEVSVDGNQVSISAETRHESRKKEGEREIYSERYTGKIYRSFTLPSDVDDSKAQAHYEDGVLNLTLPKKGNGQTRRITVS